MTLKTLERERETYQRERNMIPICPKLGKLAIRPSPSLKVLSIAVGHSQTYQCGYYTNLVNDKDFSINSTPEICEHQEPPSQVEVEVPIKKSQRGSSFIVAEVNRLVEVWISVSMYAVQVQLLTQGVQLYNCLIKSLIGQMVGLASLSLTARIRGYSGVTPITRERGVTPQFETSNIFLVKEKHYFFIS
ncbi:hypothetical protein FH972_010826 [Carpinus fangiana]|uniref:Uncharacterized protein n=1 Tax=Carpinus fangiana TaxID=176857 RepID=A0A660KRA7_9ROSI|nr:hypothetical protein FH972_010826 [Carpinus fangiana]